MKRILVSTILFLIVIALVIFGILRNKEEKTVLTKVTLAEVDNIVF